MSVTKQEALSHIAALWGVYNDAYNTYIDNGGSAGSSLSPSQVKWYCTAINSYIAQLESDSTVGISDESDYKDVIDNIVGWATYTRSIYNPNPNGFFIASMLNMATYIKGVLDDPTKKIPAPPVPKAA